MKLFISYSRDDAGNFARHIHRFMKTKGHDVFIDVNSITIGDPWARSIEKNISECDIFVVILTPDALSSSYVEKEVLQAQKQNKIMVPCIHQYVDYSEIKWGLQENQGIEFSDKYELALNLYPQITNFEKVVNKKQDDMSQQKTVQDISSRGTMPAGWTPSYSSSYSSDTPSYYDPRSKGTMPAGWKPSSSSYSSDTFPYYEDATSLINKGIALSDQGKYQEAIECYDKALRVNPNNTQALNNKGAAALTELGKHKEAIKWYDKALAIVPNDVYPLTGKGWAFYNLGKYKEAIECYDKALSVDPNFTYAINNKETALEKLSKGWRNL